MSLIFKGGLNVNRNQNTDVQYLEKYKEKITKEIEDTKQRELDQVIFH